MRSREIQLTARPVGMPETSHFSAVDVNLPAPQKGQVLVRNIWLSVDPAMRGRMVDAKSYVPPYALNAPLEGPAIGEVVSCPSGRFPSGTLVCSDFGWREAFVAAEAEVERLDPGPLPPQAFLGVAGIPGLTAYVGLMRIAELQASDTVFVSAASGAVGSMACQIAKNKGCRVIAAAGGEEKLAYLRDVIGVDATIDYKSVKSLTKALAQAAPQGIDVYFDNVGGEHLQAAIAVANRFARFAICGMISQYNLTTAPAAPRNLTLIMGKALRLQGYIVFDHLDMRPAFIEDIAHWHQQGTLHWQETIYQGIDKMPDALIGLFQGENLGKMLIRV